VATQLPSFGDELTPLATEARALVGALLVAEVTSLLALYVVLHLDRCELRSIGWRVPHGSTLLNELLLGLVAGAIMGGLYLYLEQPSVDTGNITLPLFELPGARSYLGFIAYVLLAPFVEESIYRGYGFSRLRSRHRTRIATSITAIVFGLLSWTGGPWAIVLSILAMGVPLALLSKWRGTIWPAFAARVMMGAIVFTAGA
jgi:membrane protease YdiL (CAAX protease family)